MAEAAGIGCPAPIFPVRDLDAALAFYERLGFKVWKYDEGYGYAQREGLTLHLQWRPPADPSTGSCAVWVKTQHVDELHAEWLECGLELNMSTPEDKPWRVREFAIKDPDHNLLRFGRHLR